MIHRLCLFLRCQIIIYLAIGVLAFVMHRLVTAQTPDNMVVHKIPFTPENYRNSEGAFITLNDGTILFAYSQFGESTQEKAFLDADPARIVAIESGDRGLTWSGKPRVLVENFASQNLMSVSLLRLKSGKIAMFYIAKNSIHDCRPYMQLSSDETTSWTEPRPVFRTPGYFVLNNDRVVQLNNGRLICPVSYHRSIYRSSEKSADWRGIALWYLSDDEGKTWYESETWWALPFASQHGLQEPGVVELIDGSLISWARTDQGCQYGFRSTDQGSTWSSPEPTGLVSPVSPAGIKKIPWTSDLIAVYNDHSGRFPYVKNKRTPLVVAISKDGGKTWPVRKMIESEHPDGHFCYTAIHFVDDFVLLAYFAGKKTIALGGPFLIRRMSLEWLYKK